MRVTFVNPPKSDVGLAELTPPLGLLKLAGVARAVGADPVICDLNLLWHLDSEMRQSFYDNALELLLESGSEIFAFSSMCVDSHIALELANRLKARDPGITVVLGGPHFSSIAQEVKAAFSSVDHVIEGEGEIPFANLLMSLRVGGVRLGSSEADLIQSHGIDFPFQGIRSLPDTCYDLVDLRAYFALNPRQMADFETGRGCRFKCAFCYSPNHYSAVRAFELPQVLADLTRLEALGFKRFSLVDDNFLNSSDRAFEFCDALSSRKLALRWQCYATFPQITEKLADAMNAAGCDQIFSGIDAVGPNAQIVLRKAFLPPSERFEAKLHMLIERGITPTCAFLLCPPSYVGGEDLESTMRAALTARLCGAKIRLNTLTLYNGTLALQGCRQPEPDSLKTRLMLDVPPIAEQNHFARARPDLFPFHSRYVCRDEWGDFLQLAHCLSTTMDAFPMTLDLIWKDRGLSPIDVAKRVLLEVGDLVKIDKKDRRAHEQISAYEVLRDLAVEPSHCKTLEVESPFEDSLQLEH
jgi:B12 binding domain/Radical SAM superfamily